MTTVWLSGRPIYYWAADVMNYHDIGTYLRNPQMSGRSRELALNQSISALSFERIVHHHSTNMQIHHGKKAGSRTTPDRSPYIEETRSRLERLLSP